MCLRDMICEVVVLIFLACATYVALLIPEDRVCQNEKECLTLYGE